MYIEDSLGERIWVDSPHCRTFVDNIQTAFNTKMPPKSVLLQMGQQNSPFMSKWDWSSGLKSRLELLS